MNAYELRRRYYDYCAVLTVSLCSLCAVTCGGEDETRETTQTANVTGPGVGGGQGGGNAGGFGGGGLMGAGGGSFDFLVTNTAREPVEGAGVAVDQGSGLRVERVTDATGHAAFAGLDLADITYVTTHKDGY